VHPAMMDKVAQARITDMRQAASRRAAGRAHAVGSVRSLGMAPGAEARPAAARRAIGWFLVGVGLRLAVPRRHRVATL
jgi:hypothetical protein